MLKVLIVDDDFPVRMFLKRVIDWNKYGFEVIGEAIDGREALQKIELLRPDAVILDISMPVMNGVEVIREVQHRSDITCKFIVLSFYDDFEYVKETLKSGAVEYILKNALKPEELIKLLGSIKQQIEQERAEEGRFQEIKKLAGEGLLIMKQQFIRQLISEEIMDSESIERKIRELKMNFCAYKNVIIIVETDKDSKVSENIGEKRPVNYSALDICQEILDDLNTGEAAQVSDRHFIIVLGFCEYSSYADIYKSLYTLTDRIMNNMRKYLNFEVTIGVSDVGDKLQKVSICYKQAKQALEHKFYRGKNKSIYFKDIKPFKDMPQIISRGKDTEIKHYLDSDKIEELLNSVRETLEFCKNNIIIPKQVFQYCMELMVQVRVMVKQYDTTLKEVLGFETLSFEIFNGIETYQQLEHLITDVLEKLYSLMNTKKVPEVLNDSIKEALRYIQFNYMKDISLSTVAGHIRMNPSYFSHLFKQETGKNFMEYLKDIRMQKAKLLMETTNMKISEVAKAVGIINIKRFSRLFKAATGISPIEYKKNKNSSTEK